MALLGGVVNVGRSVLLGLGSEVSKLHTRLQPTDEVVKFSVPAPAPCPNAPAMRIFNNTF